MHHFLRQHVPGNPPKISITSETFQAIKASRDVLTNTFALEEAFDLVVSNYIELEQDVLTASVSEVCRQVHDYDDFFDLRSNINRRFVNLLSACRSYIDQAPQLLKKTTADPTNAKNNFKKCLNEHYDASFSYRLLEALRNHVQHCGLAVHRISINNNWVEVNNDRRLEVSIQPFATRKYLALDAKFKRAVLEEAPEELPLLGHLRAYMGALGNAHKLVREAVSESSQRARSNIESHIKSYATINDGVTIGLAAISTGEDQNLYIETIPLFLNWDDVRLKLEKRNSTLQGLSNRAFVSRGS